MNTAPEPLPDDIAALRAMLVAAWAERDAERAEKEEIAAQNDRLRHLIRNRPVKAGLREGIGSGW